MEDEQDEVEENEVFKFQPLPKFEEFD